MSTVCLSMSHHDPVILSGVTRAVYHARRVSGLSLFEKSTLFHLHFTARIFTEPVGEADYPPF